MTSERLSVRLVEQGVWASRRESMPLASGYLKATALADERIEHGANIEIVSFRGGTTLAEMAAELFTGAVPDVLAFSVLGWNYRSFGELAETFKQLNPHGWVVFGGTHVSGQSERVFRMYPAVDVVVNGEGEFVFREILHAYLDGGDAGDLDTLSHIDGISYRKRDGTAHTTRERERIQDLEQIPSPVLTGAIPLTDTDGAFRYRVGLMETNRGCPYKCAFCYWGGAIGQKVRTFSRGRLRAEIETFARLKVHSIFLCDANFGMLRSDVDFIDDVIAVRAEYGFPKALVASWAKNKSLTFYEIVKKMKRAGLHSSFVLSLQTLDDDVLATMNRKNMKVNDWEDLVSWLATEDMDVKAELIWGAPGETPETFMAGYDRLARHVTQISPYPMMILPNTDYATKKAEHGFITVRGDSDDFEYVLAHRSTSLTENQEMLRLLFWIRVLAEMLVLRNIWVGMAELAGFTQTQLLRDFARWIDGADDPVAGALRAARDATVGGRDQRGVAVGILYTDPAAKDLLRRWWRESVRDRLATEHRPLLDEMIRYDLETHPVHAPPEAATEPGLPTEVRDGVEYYVARAVGFAYDIPRIVASLRAGRPVDLTPRPTTFDLYYRRGSEHVVHSTSHEILYYLGKPLQGDNM